MKKLILLLSAFIFFTNILIGQTRIDPTEYPYAYIVKLLMHKNGSTFHGTGIIINKNSIITNAHNVYGKESISIYPGYSKDDNSPFGVIEVNCELNKTIFYPKKYNVNTIINDLYDFAVIKFDNEEIFNKILEKSGNRKFNVVPIDISELKTINISGYPFFRWFELWKPREAKVQYHNSTEKYTISKKNLLNYKMNTRKGSSGSPLWIEKDGKLLVIGIHKTGGGFKNQGVFYDSERLDLLKQWIEK